jgi:hypothetical protein
MGVPNSDEHIRASATKQFSELVMIKNGLDALSICCGFISLNSLVVSGASRDFQVAFEILSPGNRLTQIVRKRTFYEQHGVEEYYVYDPDTFEFLVFVRTEEGRLEPVERSDGFVSPLLGVRFVATGEDPWTLFRPDGEAFLSYVALMESRNDARNQAARESERAEAERERAERLAARLREAGIDPDAV